jgi:hypothetical protein
MNIVSKPHIWNCGANAVSFKTQQALQITGLKGTTTPSTSTPPHTNITSMLGHSVSIVYVMCEFSEIEE